MSNAHELLKAEEQIVNDRIHAIDLQIYYLLRDRRMLEEGLHRIVDSVIEHADIIVEVPIQLSIENEAKS